MPAATSDPAVTTFDPSLHGSLLPLFVTLHTSCIDSDDMLAHFLPPLSPSRILSYWESFAAEVRAGTRTIFFTTDAAPSSSSSTDKITSAVSAHYPFSETEPWVVSVQKLLVAPSHRRLGLARGVMQALEKEALARARPILTLDTVVGSAAELVYPRLGWKEIGRVPDYGISPRHGTLVDVVFFYKDLRKVEGGHARGQET